MVDQGSSPASLSEIAQKTYRKEKEKTLSARKDPRPDRVFCRYFVLRA
jgi:hypothetical protein